MLIIQYLVEYYTMNNTEEFEKLFQSRIRNEREKAQMSQLDLSLCSGISQNMITYIETGKRTPTLRTIIKICNALNINPAILFADEDSEKQKIKKSVIDLIQRFL